MGKCTETKRPSPDTGACANNTLLCPGTWAGFDQEFRRFDDWTLESPHVEYAERRIKYSILFVFRPFHEYSNLEYEHVPVWYRVHQAEYGIHIRVAASQECVKTYSTRRLESRIMKLTIFLSTPPQIPLPLSLVQQGCLRFGVSRCGLAAAVVGRGC